MHLLTPEELQSDTVPENPDSSHHHGQGSNFAACSCTATGNEHSSCLDAGRASDDDMDVLLVVYRL
jgi:hypothetical protein